MAFIYFIGNKENIMKKLLSILCMVISFPAMASTLAGTTISNQASLEYSVVGSASKTTTQSNVSTFVVNELIDVQLLWTDASQIAVNSPDTKKVLTFKITNTGNGNQNYNLTSNNNIGGGNFNPIINGTTIYVENGLSSGLQLDGAYKDKEYVVNDIVSLSPGEYKNIYLVYDIPSGLSISSKGFAQLSAVSTSTGVANAQNAGTIIQGVQSGSQIIDIILGHSLGKSQANGNYIISGLIVNHEKTIVSVLDNNGGSLVMSGSEITYQIKVDISGTGTAKNLVISDQLPNELNYVENSLTLNGVLISDTNVINNKISVSIGDQTPNKTFILQFKTKIK